MASFNRVILIGNITRDVELKYVRSDLAVTEIGLAVNDRRKNQSGEWVDETTFVDVTLWGRTAEIASEFLMKGSQVLIEGRLKLDTWETEGQKRSKLRVVGEQLKMLGSRPDGQAKGGNGRSGAAAGAAGQVGPPHAEFDESEYRQPATASVGRATAGGPPKDDIPF